MDTILAIKKKRENQIHMPEKYTTPYPARRIHSDGRAEDTEVLLARECPVKLFLDGKPFTTLFASPLELKELAVGHLITEGILSFKEIAGVEVEGNEVYILTLKGKHLIQDESPQPAEREPEKQIFVNSDAVFDPESIFAGTAYLESDTYKLTRGTHLAALIDKKGKLAVQIVDVGRHNAVDKVVGAAFLRMIDLSQHYMLSTGRQPAYMVTKAARAGIPLVATKAMPFDSGVEAAKKANLCLVGQLRKESMLIFTNEWRVGI
ncbi:formate dehydrogenase accessory sulfurtransferase FdhD [Methanosarcina mazei]|jgi:FdhD protein|uniref:Protein FdhD n=3 Tax=Methanosarcina mazei TaxID=2209 RepID=M1PXD7_METMZ|nr:formate dehydrogenase accessory sulfurtransferase FdhD [Methanosarcina mazei]AGF96921.1 Formate dehydrogenase chain D [Methanosarcina mazei Tuc01]AKB69705.1 Formate dehydrogenase chain D [Methanosarcina mazei LYC]MDY0246012.1 formate dehydrogenase accessory sulfurtransferase FdhD [Methanosarcina mazei]UWJ24545.1 Formate dehydrogenase chain D [Methanosarcina mazei TMA]BBL65922.1 sulfurtransferase FdhD [Methanosarcina mazei]